MLFYISFNKWNQIGKRTFYLIIVFIFQSIFVGRFSNAFYGFLVVHFCFPFLTGFHDIYIIWLTSLHVIIVDTTCFRQKSSGASFKLFLFSCSEDDQQLVRTIKSWSFAYTRLDRLIFIYLFFCFCALILLHDQLDSVIRSASIFHSFHIFSGCCSFGCSCYLGREFCFCCFSFSLRSQFFNLKRVNSED